LTLLVLQLLQLLQLLLLLPLPLLLLLLLLLLCERKTRARSIIQSRIHAMRLVSVLLIRVLCCKLALGLAMGE